jgi:hypothetical protein
MIKFQQLLEKIVKRGENYLVMSSSGDQVLGKHETREKALKQLAAVEISKKKRGK